MTNSPEVKSGLPVQERPEEFPEIPVEVENKNLHTQSVPVQFRAQVNDNQGKPLIQTPQNQSVTVQIPFDQTTLENSAKGSTEDSGTWFAAWFLRLVKKALHFGWNVIVGKGNNGTTTN